MAGIPRSDWGRQRLILAPLLLLQSAGACAAENDALAAAQNQLLRGNYAEAAEAYGKLAEEHPVASATGLAECHLAQGRVQQGISTLADARRQAPQAAELPARLAELEFQTGRYKEAAELAEVALALDDNELRARWVRAELHRTAGRLEEAARQYRWFVEFYNRQPQFRDPAALRRIGWAAARHARWNRLSDQFSLLVNDLYPSGLELQPAWWPAHYEAGLLYLEKFNQAEATREFQAALAINPHAADVYVALAELAIQQYELEKAAELIERAASIQPRHFGAALAQADIHLANFSPEQAVEVLESSRERNPRSEALLGRLAAAYALRDGFTGDENQARLARLFDEVESKNPHCGEFYFAMGAALDKGRHFPRAAESFQRASEVMPQLVGPRGQLGLMQMRLGREDEARRVLEEAFRLDPFNVRVNNSLQVLEVLQGYATLETEHFLIRYDPAHDQVLARHAARYLEQIYPELCRRLDYRPAEKSLFEIFHDARNTGAHGWFSARMVGLPAIHTIGACAGQMVALTSPTAMDKRFNWARVLKHELVHVINLQQTHFNIPHWYTEALAVLLEDQPRSAEWEKVLARRAAAGDLFDLETINRGFIRPHSSDDWILAYCQAEMYAEYLVERFGPGSLGKMLEGYAKNLSTSEAIASQLDVSMAEFERGYRAYVASIVDQIEHSAGDQLVQLPLSELQRRHAENPQDVDVAAQLALAYLDRKLDARAGALAGHVLEQQPRHPLAGYVKARLRLKVGEARAAHDLLVDCLDTEPPNLRVVKLLAALRLQSGDHAGAEKLYLLGQRRQPRNVDWNRALALTYLRWGKKAELAEQLARIASVEEDDVATRKKLAELAFAAGDHVRALHWGGQGLEIDVTDPALHQIVSRSLTELGRHGEAAWHYQSLQLLRPNDRQVAMALAGAWQRAEHIDKAVVVLQKWLATHPDDRQARALLEKLRSAASSPDSDNDAPEPASR